MHWNFIFIVLGIVISNKLSYCERLHGQIYSSIEGGAPCFRRLNGSQQAGCATPDEGAVGVVHLVREVRDANWLVLNASAGPYMAIVNTALFNKIINIFLDQPANIAGVVLFHNSSLEVTNFSQDLKCPNEYASGPGSTCSASKPGSSVWNEKGTNLMRRDIPFPILYMPESRIKEINKIEECFERYNSDLENQKGKPLCSVQLNSFMFAVVNSEVCIRRSVTSLLVTPSRICDPLGDQNVYYSLLPQNKETKKPVIMVTARIDSGTLFDGVAPSAASSVVGMVTLITAAATLAQMMPKENKTYDTNVLWTLFNGETFDYIGSQKVAYDMKYGEWPPTAPLKLKDIALYLELGQIGGSLLAHRDEEAWPLNLFTPVDANNINEVSEVMNGLSEYLSKHNMTVELTPTQNLPPSSLHSFRRIAQYSPNGGNISNIASEGEMAQMVLADFKERFTNMYYNSPLDDYPNIAFDYHNISIGNDGKFISTDDLIANGTMKRTETQVKISLLATAVARTLYKKVVGESYAGNVSASAHLVDEMLYCFLRSQACRLLMVADYAQTGGGEEKLPQKPAYLYIGVSSWDSTAPVFAGHLIAFLTGDHLHIKRTECEAMNNPQYSYYWLKGWNHTGVCIQTTMNFSQAISPAFSIPNYNYTSGDFSTWTESVWRTMWARVFVSSGGGGARAAAAAGAIATAVVAVLTYWIKKRAPQIFVHAPVTMPAANHAAAV